VFRKKDGARRSMVSTQCCECISMPRMVSALISRCESLRSGASASVGARAQHAGHFAEKGGLVRVVIRGFDVHHRIKGLVGEGQVLGIALHEIQARQSVPLFAERDARRVQVQSV
jgi:hypothetical protein